MLATHCYGYRSLKADVSAVHVMLAYYAATVLFLLMDLALGINVRIAFLEGSVALRFGYYAVCFVCLGLMLWRPTWTAIISAFESLVTLVALIISFGMRAILVSDAVLEGREPFISMPAIVNFLLAGSIAYLAFNRGLSALRG